MIADLHSWIFSSSLRARVSICLIRLSQPLISSSSSSRARRRGDSLCGERDGFGGDLWCSIGSEYSSDFSDVSSDCSLTLSDISDSYDHSEDHALVDEALRKECPAIESATRIVHINTLGEYERLEFLRRKQCDEDNGTVMEDGQDYKVKKHWRVRCYRSVGTGGDSDYDMKEVETLIDEDILGVLKID